MDGDFDFGTLQRVLTSLAIGLLMGLERQRRRSSRAGLRTFALVALLGTLTAMLDERHGNHWLLVAGFLAAAAMIIGAYLRQPDRSDPGTTSMAAVLVCYLLGALVWYGEARLAVMLAIATTILLYFKAQLHGITRQLTPRDLTSVLQFAVLSLVILPILPDRGFGPNEALNPHQIWLMVVLVSGMSLAGYAALRIFGARAGAPLLGFFGGVVSSTATTLVFSRHARGRGELADTAALVVLVANLVMMLRLAAMVGMLAPGLIWPVARMLALPLLAGALALALIRHRLGKSGVLPMPEVANPTEIRVALGFGALYALVLTCAAWLSDYAGSGGLYAVALVSGLTDVDAITLSSLHLFGLGRLDGNQAIVALAIAALANLGFKIATILVVAGVTAARRMVPPLLAVAGALVAALAANA